MADFTCIFKNHFIGIWQACDNSLSDSASEASLADVIQYVTSSHTQKEKLDRGSNISLNKMLYRSP